MQIVSQAAVHIQGGSDVCGNMYRTCMCHTSGTDQV